MHKRLLLLVVPTLAAGLIAAGCGDDGQDSSGNTSTTSTTSATEATKPMGEGTDSGASALRSTLTAALQEHVYLAGIAINTGVGSGLDSKEFKAAAGTLDTNSKALADAIGGVYGDEAGEQFLALWRDHIGFFVAYTKAKAEGDEKAADKARADLDGYRKEFGAFLASANPNLTADAVAEELVPHVDSVFTTIDSVVAKKADVFDNLAEAASHMPNTANVLAGAIAKQYPDKFPAA